MNIAPMLCETGNVGMLDQEPFKSWIRDLKLDGDRVIAIDGRLFNRRGNDITDLFPEIKPNKDLAMDGEVVILNNGISDFNMLSKRTHLKVTNPKVQELSKSTPAQFVVFDVLMAGDKVLTALPLKQRRDWLKQVSGDNVKTITEFGQPDWNEVLDKGLEGVIIKNPESQYEFKRSRSWLKVKNFKEKVVRFTGYENHDNNNNGITLTNGLNRVSCNGQQCEEVKRKLTEQGFVDVEVQYLSESKEGHLRMPSFRGLK